MSGPIWYYAQGDAEKGPLTTAQIKALAAAGKIRRDDYVWKQGMETWAPAREVPDLFAAETSSERSEPGGSVRAAQGAERQLPRQRISRAPILPVGKLLLALGLPTVLLARGCDTLAVRNIGRLQAIPVADQRRFEETWQRERQRIEEQLAAAGDAAPSAESADALKGELENLNQARLAQRNQLEAGPWRQQRDDAAAAETEQQIWGYWREAAFQAGTAVLAAGLFTVALASQGPDRWLSLGLLGAIVYSLYVANR